jgi:hypothetical protein
MKATRRRLYALLSRVGCAPVVFGIGGLAFLLLSNADAHFLMQILNSLKGAALAVLLPVENAIYGRLRRAKFIGNPWLAPAGRSLDLL